MLRAACPAPPRLPGQGTDTSFYWPLTEGGGMNGERLLTSTAGGGMNAEAPRPSSPAVFTVDRRFSPFGRFTVPPHWRASVGPVPYSHGGVLWSLSLL